MFLFFFLQHAAHLRVMMHESSQPVSAVGLFIRAGQIANLIYSFYGFRFHSHTRLKVAQSLQIEQIGGIW